MNHSKLSVRNIALIYQGKVIDVKVVIDRRSIICRKLKWRKLYGPLFRKCTFEINFNK